MPLKQSTQTVMELAITSMPIRKIPLNLLESEDESSTNIANITIIVGVILALIVVFVCLRPAKTANQTCQ